MTTGIDEITQLALTLPVDQRAQVANALLASLDDAADSAEVHEAWTAEIKSRVDDITSGRVQMLSRNEVRAQLAADRAARQQR
ncbi:addiction module protein [Nocardioides sp. LHD-245]|uniref:addiction module protein n=1 Tax=Nocardioides sp. LHD-245 TaxID=3051387 RepID=UPI0027E20215|nr:addiction module protein [Nocardioides sp. LHD-245]